MAFPIEDTSRVNHQKQGDPCIYVHSGTGSLIWLGLELG